MPAVPAPTPARTVRVIVVGVQPDLDHLAVVLNSQVAEADDVVLIHIPGDPASETARTMWTAATGWHVENPPDLPTIPIVLSLHLAQLEPDLVLVCQPQTTRHQLAAALRVAGQRAGAKVLELKRADHAAGRSPR